MNTVGYLHCTNAKRIQNALQTAYEGTNQVQNWRIEFLIRNYELFPVKENEPIQDVITRLTMMLKKMSPFST